MKAGRGPSTKIAMIVTEAHCALLIELELTVQGFEQPKLCMVTSLRGPPRASAPRDESRLIHVADVLIIMILHAGFASLRWPPKIQFGNIHWNGSGPCPD
eukprot:2008101-Amphidinium_carterae.1